MRNSRTETQASGMKVKFSCSNFTDLVFITKIQGIGIVLFLKDLTDAFLLSEFILV